MGKGRDKDGTGTGQGWDRDMTETEQGWGARQHFEFAMQFSLFFGKLPV